MLVIIIGQLDAGTSANDFRTQASRIAQRLLGRARTLVSTATKVGINVTNLTVTQPKTAIWAAGSEVEAQADLATGVVWFRCKSSIPWRKGVLAIAFVPQEDRPRSR